MLKAILARQVGEIFDWCRTSGVVEERFVRSSFGSSQFILLAQVVHVDVILFLVHKSQLGGFQHCITKWSGLVGLKDIEIT